MGKLNNALRTENDQLIKKLKREGIMTPSNSPIREPITWEYEIGFPFAPPEEIKIEESNQEKPSM